MARPSKYETHIKPYFKEIKEAVERGVEENKIASNLGVSVSTWCEYKNKYSEFAEVLKRDEETTKEILEKLDSALLKSAYGYEYEEKKQYITEDADGNKKRHTEITTRHQPPNVTAIFGAYNRFDKNYVKDAAYYELKKQELELRKAIAEANNFDLEMGE